MKRERLLNVPNLITGLRIILVLMFIAVHFTLPGKKNLAIAAFIAAGISDFLDGFLARRFHQITWLGQILDPFADKIMILGAFICLVASKVVPIWLVGLIILKELYMIIGGTMLLQKEIVIPADWMGKLSTFLFIIAVIMVYPWHEMILVRKAGMIELFSSAALSLFAAVHYTISAVKKSHEPKID